MQSENQEIKNQELSNYCFQLISNFTLALKNSVPSEARLRLNSHTFFVLVTLMQEQGEKLTMTMLADQLQISKQQLTKLVNDMERRGIVERIHDTENRRQVYIRITEDGRKELSDFTGEALRSFQRALDGYTPEEKERLEESFYLLNEFLEKARKYIGEDLG